MKVTIDLTEEQAYVVEEALELYSRIGMAQFDQIEYRMYLDTYDKSLKRKKYDRDLVKNALNQVRGIIFDQLETDGSYIGIMDTSERNKISWDIYQQLRHDIAHFKCPEITTTTKGVSFDKPLVTSKQPLPKITITEE